MQTQAQTTTATPTKKLALLPLGRFLTQLAPHLVLVGYSMIAVFPIFLTVINSFKTRREIFSAPYGLPSPIYLDGYKTVFSRASVPSYFLNSLVVTLASIALILILGAMAAHALAEYNFRGNHLIRLYMLLGIMIPIRLGTVSLIKLATTLNIYNNLLSLILIYTAAGLPIAILILTEFMRQTPRELKDAARVDGASEYRILFQLVFPLLRPALATVAVFNMIPVWNDLWFPLVLTQHDKVRTITLGVSTFVGQFKTNWTAMLASLTLAMLPVLILYAIFSRQLIRGLTAGAVK